MDFFITSQVGVNLEIYNQFNSNGLDTTRLTPDKYLEGILKNDRIILARAITLVESLREEDEQDSNTLIDKILPYTGNSVRIGITGSPGVGKSTFIEVFGKYITSENKKIAVLTIDPSSQITKGSILGDKTRMEDLSRNKMAFIRPTSSGNALGGTANKTREVMLLCEAAGYEVIVVETVGVGQSEVAVKNMTDFFLLLVLARAGDELQGIKKGIVEMSDAIVITKADGNSMKDAERARVEYQQALHYTDDSPKGTKKVLMCSALTGEGIAEIWKTIMEYITASKLSGYFDENRLGQMQWWFHENFQQMITRDVSRNPEVVKARELLLMQIRNKTISPQSAALKLLETYHKYYLKDRSGKNAQ